MVGGALCDRYVPATAWIGAAGTGVGPAQTGACSAGMATRSGSTSQAGGSTGQAPASGPAESGRVGARPLDDDGVDADGRGEAGSGAEAAGAGSPNRSSPGGSPPRAAASGSVEMPSRAAISGTWLGSTTYTISRCRRGQNSSTMPMRKATVPRMSSPCVVGSSQRGVIAALAPTSPTGAPAGVITTRARCSPRRLDGDQNSVPEVLETSQNVWSTGGAAGCAPATADVDTGSPPRASRTRVTA